MSLRTPAFALLAFGALASSASACSPQTASSPYRVRSSLDISTNWAPLHPPSLSALMNSTLCGGRAASVSTTVVSAPARPELPAMRLRCWQQGVAIVDEPVQELASSNHPVLADSTAPGPEKAVLVTAGQAMCLVSGSRVVSPARAAKGRPTIDAALPLLPRVGQP